MAASTSAWGRYPALAHFSTGQSAALASCATQLRFEDGALVLKEKEPSSDIYLVEAGGLVLSRDTPYGRFNLAHLGVGEMCGETSFLDRAPRSVDASAVGATTLWVLPSADIQSRVESDSAFSLAMHWAIWKSLSSKLRSANALLPRFFPSVDAPRERPRDPSGPGQVRVGVAEKRSVFEEHKLSNLEINFLSSLSQERSYTAGATLFREGDPGDAMYVVLDGKVRISKTIPGVGEEALSILERGAFFGEMALIDNLPRSADARAHDKGAVVLRIPREVVEQLLDIRKVSSLRLLRLLCELVAARLRELDDKLVGWHILSGGEGARH
jgi:CRP-like cAMP-binding protein